MTDRYIVFLKQVPKSTKVLMDSATNTLIRSSAATMVNPDDLHSLVEAVRLKNERGGEVIAVSMGPQSAIEVLRKSLLYGADKAILVSDRAFAGSDTLATSRVLASVAQKLAPFKMLFFGKMAIDGDTAQVGPEVAALLSIAQATEVKSIKEWGDTSFTYIKDCGDTMQIREVDYPSVITISKEFNILPAPTISQWRESVDKPIQTYTIGDLDVDYSHVGLSGSPTQVVETSVVCDSKPIEFLNKPEQLITLIKTINNRNDVSIKIK